MRLSILKTNSKLLVQLPNSNSSVVRNHADKGLAHVANVVVIMEERNMPLYRFRSRLPVRCKYFEQFTNRG